MRSTIEMTSGATVTKTGHFVFTLTELKAFEALVRADEREVSLDAVLRVIKELYPALVLAAFSNRDKAWAIDKIKENIEKLKETK
jgi:hypothetical protein